MGSTHQSGNRSGQTIQYALQDCISGLCCPLCWTACIYRRIPRMAGIQECRACSHCSLCRTSCSCWWQLCTRPTELAGSAAAIVAAGAGRRKRQVQVVGSPEWQAYKNAELAHIAPSVGPLAAAGRNWHQEQLNYIAEQQAIVAAGAGRRKRQVQVEGSPEW